MVSIWFLKLKYRVIILPIKTGLNWFVTGFFFCFIWKTATGGFKKTSCSPVVEMVFPTAATRLQNTMPEMYIIKHQLILEGLVKRKKIQKCKFNTSGTHSTIMHCIFSSQVENYYDTMSTQMHEVLWFQCSHKDEICDCLVEKFIPQKQIKKHTSKFTHPLSEIHTP